MINQRGVTLVFTAIDKKGNIAKQFTHVTAKELKKLLELEVNR